MACVEIGDSRTSNASVSENRRLLMPAGIAAGGRSPYLVQRQRMKDISRPHACGLLRLPVSVAAVALSFCLSVLQHYLLHSPPLLHSPTIYLSCMFPATGGSVVDEDQMRFESGQSKYDCLTDLPPKYRIWLAILHLRLSGFMPVSITFGSREHTGSMAIILSSPPACRDTSASGR